MAVPRTPRPPIVVPKPPERVLDPDEIEKWLARLARSIRLKRLEQGFLGSGSRSGESGTRLARTADGGTSEARKA